MPSADAVSNVSGRNSRASNVSVNTGASRSHRSQPPHDSWTNAGVLSMLKTSTDTGDIGALSFNSSRLPTLPRNAHTKRGHVKRPSTSAPPQHIPPVSSNHSYAPSQNSRISSQWDASSTHRRGSLTSMQSMPPALPPVHLSGMPPQATMPSSTDNRRDSRSYSLTSAHPGQPLPRHQSATSLKSQGHEPRHGQRMAAGGPFPPGMSENRPPFVYPTRLKRPGYRSPSPALSDTYGGHAPPPGAFPMGRGMPPPRGPPPGAYNGYNAGYPMEYAQDPRHLNVRPPPRTANNSPNNVGWDTNPYNYRPNPPRPAPSLGMPHQMPQPMMHQGLPPMSSNPNQAPRGQYGPQYASRQGYAPYSHMQYPGQRGPPPNPAVAPMAHQMFHNAARMARHLPQRTDTPMTDMSPPSSDPPSSGSAPTSSSPPTPKDHTDIRVAVDPAFIDPALMDLPNSSSEPVLPAKYFEYADGPVDDQEMEVPHPSVPPSGFVQRVKAMLESKALVEAAAENDFEKANHQALMHNHHFMHQYAMEHDAEEVSELQEFHEMAANETPRFTVIEEFQAPVELPASPVKVPELEANEVTSAPSTQRITREMIRAELGPSSNDNTQQRSASADSTTQTGPRRESHEQAQAYPEPSPDDLDYQADYDSRKSSLRSVESVQHEEATMGHETVTSVEASLPTGVDYALRFCAPIDTTISADETQSKDPFALDADTLTLQQQRTKEVTPQAENHQDLQGPPSPELTREKRSRVFSVTPISPLRSDEVVKRSSAVSPLHTQSRGIDETLGLGSRDMTMTTNTEEVSETDLDAEDTMPPPTPRTPKTYSKSVQLPPNANGPDRTTTNTNRFSLPGDLSTIGDTTMCSASEMVTDVAVRFSLPGTTITVGKPQIVDVSAGSTPDKPRFDFGLPQRLLQDAEPRRRTSSVTFADEVAPLNFKKQEPSRLQNVSEPPSTKAKSIIRKPSPREDFTESSRTTSRDSTTDLRFAGNNTNGILKGFGSTHLPGLKEESVEDMSISSRRSSGMVSFPLPARIAAVKAMQERRLKETADKTKARRQARQYNRSLADTKDLPSLNFSRMDLIDKLNQALDLRTTKSLDVMRRRDFSGIHCPSPQRPLSTEPLRDRYTSFFSKPEDFSFFDDMDDSDAEPDQENEAEPNTETALVPVVQIQEQTQIEGVEPDKRPLSPEDFLSVATQVNRLSIPSVNGLSERLSELIPGLRNLSSLQIDSVLPHDDNHGVHEISGQEIARPDTVLTNRTSAGFRTLAERAEEIVKNGTHDSVVAAIRALSLNINKELPALPGSASVDMLAGLPIASADAKTAYLSGSVSVPTDLHKDPTRPMSAVMLRAKTPTTEDEVRQMLPSGLNPIARNARRSMILSHPTSRPWNLDKNYPWSGDEVEIDLSVPDQAHTRESFTKDLLRKRTTRSLDLTGQGEATSTTQGIDVGDLIDTRLGSTTSLTTSQLASITPQHFRKTSKRSIIGSISKKFGLSPRGAFVDEDTTLKSVQSRSPVPRVSSAAQSYQRAGDRYPTSGLTPPANFHIDEVRSFFSDNSSEHERTASFRKRLTHFKGTKIKSTARLGGLRGHSIDLGNTTYDAGSMAEARLGTNSSANTYDGVGMSKTEFHIKRFGEKLRHLFARGGELIRTMSVKSRVRGRMDHNQDEWLADSLYSGV